MSQFQPGAGIDLSDPNVRDLMGPQHADWLRESHGATQGGSKRDLVQIAGDEDHGMSQTISMTKDKREVIVTYKDYVLTVDVYQIPGEPECVHLICPMCRHHLRISADRKRIDYSPTTGEISVEPFACTWEKADAGAHVPGLLAGGTSLCKWRVGITKNVALDHR